MERKGIKTGLITTRGFRDVLEIVRGNGLDLFNFYFGNTVAGSVSCSITA